MRYQVTITAYVTVEAASADDATEKACEQMIVVQTTDNVTVELDVTEIKEP